MRPTKLIAAAVALLAAGGVGASGPALAQAEEIPPRAIKVGPDEYRVPFVVEDDGCQFFTRWSPVDDTHRGGYYQRADGSYTESRAEADCLPTGGPTWAVSGTADKEGRWSVGDIRKSNHGPAEDDGTTYMLLARDVQGNIIASGGFERAQVTETSGLVWYGWGVRIAVPEEPIEHLVILDEEARSVYRRRWDEIRGCALGNVRGNCARE